MYFTPTVGEFRPGRNTTVTSPTKLPTDNRLRVFRGGAWINHDAAWMRAANRFGRAPADRSYNLGFRTTQSGCRMPLTKA